MDTSSIILRPPFLYTFVIFSILVSLLAGCEKDTVLAPIPVTIRIIETDVFSADLRIDQAEGLEFNNAEVEDYYRAAKPQIWKTKHWANGEPYVELLPDKANEDPKVRGKPMSYGLMEFNDISQYQKIVVSGSVDLTKIGPEFEADTLGCDISLFRTLNFTGTSFPDIYHDCFGYESRLIDNIDYSFYNFGENSSTTYLALTFSEFRQGIVGFANASLPAKDLTVKGIKYDMPVHAGTYSAIGLEVKSGTCLDFIQVKGDITINIDGLTATGFIETTTEKFLIDAGKSPEKALTLSAILSGLKNNYMATIFYGYHNNLFLEIFEPSCSGTIKFYRSGGMSAEIISTEIIYSAVQSEVQANPIIELSFPEYSPPMLVAGKGMNLTPDNIRLGDHRMISNFVSPVIAKNDNELLIFDTSFIVRGDAQRNAIRLRYLVNYGFGWVELYTTDFINQDGVYDFSKEIIHSQASQTIQVAVSILAQGQSVLTSQSDVYLTDVSLRNIDIAPVDYKPGVEIDIRFWPFTNYELCTTDLESAIYTEVDFANGQLVSLDWSNVAATIDLDENLNFNEIIEIDNHNYVFTGNISGSAGYYHSGKCYGQIYLTTSL